MSSIKDLTGQEFGYWKVLSLAYVGRPPHKDAFWTCQCGLCGGIYEIRSDSLQRGASTKCMKCAHPKKVRSL